MPTLSPSGSWKRAKNSTRALRLTILLLLLIGTWLAWSLTFWYRVSYLGSHTSLYLVEGIVGVGWMPVGRPPDFRIGWRWSEVRVHGLGRRTPWHDCLRLRIVGRGRPGDAWEVHVPVVYLLALGSAGLIAVWIRARTRAGPGVCRQCGYNLTGNVSGICPECGALCQNGEGEPRSVSMDQEQAEGKA